MASFVQSTAALPRGQASRKPTSARPLPVPCAHKRDEGKPEGLWSAVQGAAPAVALTVSMLLSSGHAGAASLGGGYGGSVGGSDPQRELVETGVGKAAIPGNNLLNDLPTPNLPTPESVGASPPAKTIQGAIEKTVSNVERTLEAGSSNVGDVREGINSQVEDGLDKAPSGIKQAASGLSKVAPDLEEAGAEAKAGVRNLFSGAQKNVNLGGSPSDIASDAKGAVQTGTNKIQNALPGNPLQNPLDSGKANLERGVSNAVDSAKQGFNSAAPSDIGKAASDAQDKAGNVFSDAKQNLERLVGGSPSDAASDAKNAFQTGTNKIQNALPGNPLQNTIDSGKGNVERGVSNAVDSAKQGLNSATSGDVGQAASNAQDKAGNIFFSAKQSLERLVGGSPSNVASDAKGALQTGANKVQDALSGNPVQNTLESGKANVERGVSNAVDSAKQGFNSGTPADTPKNFGQAKDQAFQGLSGDGLQKNTSNIYGNLFQPVIFKDADVQTGINKVKDAVSDANPLSGTSNPLNDAKKALDNNNPLSGISNPLDEAKKIFDGNKGDVERGVSNAVDSAKKGISSATPGDTPQTFKQAKDQAFQGLSGDGLQKNTSNLYGNLFQQVIFKDADLQTGVNKVKDAVSDANPLSGTSNPLNDAKKAFDNNNPLSGATNPLNDAKKALDNNNPLSGVSNPLDEAKKIFDGNKGDVERGVSNAVDSAKKGISSATPGDTPQTFKQAKDQAFQGLSGDGLQKNTSNFYGLNLYHPVLFNEGKSFETVDKMGEVLSRPGNNSNKIGENVQQTIGDAVDNFRSKTAGFERAETGMKGLADDVKQNAQEGGRKAVQEGEKPALGVFGL